MLSSDRQKAGKHGRGDANKNRLSVDEVKLLKGQDAGYLRTVLGRTRREVEKVKEEISLDQVLKRRGVSELDNEKKVLYDDNGQPLPKKRKLDLDSEDEDEDDLEEDPDTYADTLSSPPNQQPTPDPSEPLPSPRPQTKKQIQKQTLLLSQHKIQKRHRRRAREARAAKLDALRKRQKSITAAAAELELQRAKMGRTLGGTNKNGVKFKVRERKR